MLLSPKLYGDVAIYRHPSKALLVATAIPGITINAEKRLCFKFDKSIGTICCDVLSVSKNLVKVMIPSGSESLDFIGKKYVVKDRPNINNKKKKEKESLATTFQLPERRSRRAAIKKVAPSKRKSLEDNSVSEYKPTTEDISLEFKETSDEYKPFDPDSTKEPPLAAIKIESLVNLTKKIAQKASDETFEQPLPKAFSSLKDLPQVFFSLNGKIIPLPITTDDEWFLFEEKIFYRLKNKKTTLSHEKDLLKRENDRRLQDAIQDLFRSRDLGIGGNP